MERILAAVDLSDSTDDIISAAVSMSEKEHARLCVVYVEPDYQPISSGMWGDPEYVQPPDPQVGVRALERIRSDVQSRGIEVQCLHLHGSPEKEIEQVAEALHPDLVILGTHGRGAMHHMFFGSVRNQFLRHTKCPVLVVPHCGQA